MSDARIISHLTDALAGIARWYPATADPPRVRAWAHAAPTSTPPMQAAVLSLRRETVDCLTAWALLVADERDLHPGLRDVDVPALAGFLGVHAAWLAGHDAALDALAELDRLARALEEVARQRRPAKVHVGPCPEPGCEGTLTATVRRDDDLLPSRICCTTGDRDHSWEPCDWPSLGRRLVAGAVA